MNIHSFPFLNFTQLFDIKKYILRSIYRILCGFKFVKMWIYQTLLINYDYNHI